ncbi:MAG TPA: cytochrome c oxidase subunit 3, partial [Niabella sp.]|nr:cytochrome c oxidase subunit 3 [Niabella sp.]
MQRYRTLMGVTFVLGIAFVVCQIMGFSELWNQNVRFKGSSGAGQFFYAIAGLHALHVIGGMVALLVMVVKSLAGKIKLYSAVPVEVMSIYWHFVDLLWLYLLIFFIIVG